MAPMAVTTPAVVMVYSSPASPLPQISGDLTLLVIRAALPVVREALLMLVAVRLLKFASREGQPTPDELGPCAVTGAQLLIPPDPTAASSKPRAHIGPN